MPKKSPSYRQRKGYDQVIVTLTDAKTRRRRDYWLEECGSPESRELYHHVLAEWAANGRRLPHAPRDVGSAVSRGDELTVAELMAAYWRRAKQYYDGRELNKIGMVMRILRKLYASTPASARRSRIADDGHMRSWR